MTIEYREDDATRTAEVLVRGKITMEDYTAAVEPMQAFIDRHGTVKFIEVIESFSGFDPAVLWPGIKFDWRNISQISHVAVVSDLGWVGPLSKAAGALISSQVRFFQLDELNAARAWIAQA
ncbi:MAG: SpoIIAA-like protein [Roseibaca calidilacus]|uniref:SpoIIAA-like n=1 Tax=Roseibaca calidilacus TaxID=1666912 RepID=A0A0P7VYH3_9RHOB|nr:STAS/SEC14 domain-containing protein [Roseibaca calidilacus]KPP92450.1 MAG: SpoIIAA-like protein [Roseibaca calidilacus]CUX79746.1 SpoIIAA-like [Roseibaca calidilacus]